ncbi:SDR family NAD(P)-dependent oxidoreductase [Zavarzinia compransoris]|uniref:SDR family NAD(P)-dependent oxidoreductase n=1 Tax=Zavarzinia marina TaxID=2911065 RepID=UPI001F4583F0|nr:SDR family NAD(P)-dependent oxidoreductase [Zavarzinia marina]MCF4166516.1 SDR family NAD(P)-dependent oxidoreductase [Zavarzinia marina]
MGRPVHVVTGATSGMGLFLASALAEGGALVVAGARRPEAADALRARVPLGRLAVLPLDLLDPASVAAFAGAVRTLPGAASGIDALVCNAGLQVPGAPVLTPDGMDETFAANVFGHVLLVGLLMPALAPGAAVVTLGSGTHDPRNRLARLFGFRGGAFASVEALATGSGMAKGSDRYAAAKLCCILYAHAMARRHEGECLRFHAFDPGLMPGTGLARERPAPVRFAWHYILPAMRALVPGVSSPEKSARALAGHLLSGWGGRPSGAYVEFTGRPAPAAALATDDARADAMMAGLGRLAAARGWSLATNGAATPAG